MWFQLVPIPKSQPDDQQAFLKRARRAAEALGLTTRPTFDTFMDAAHHSDGMIVVASGSYRWIHVCDSMDEQAVQAVAKACDSTAIACDKPVILNEHLVWAHAVVPASATLSRTARDELDTGEEVRVDPPANGLVYLQVRRQGFIETRRAKNWLADEFNMSPDTSKLQEAGVGVSRIGAAMPNRKDALTLAASTASALDLGLTGSGAHVSRPGVGLLVSSALILACSLLCIMVCGIIWPAFFSITCFGIALIRRMRMHADADLYQRPRHRWLPWPRMRRSQAADLKTRSAGDDQNWQSKKRVHAYAYQRSTLPIPSGTLLALCRPADREGSQTRLSFCPQNLIHADGPRVGVDAVQRDVRIPSTAVWAGISLFGGPGGGKSNTMHGLERWAVEHCTSSDATIIFESKGSDSVPILNQLLQSPRLVDLNNPATPMISLLGEGTTARQADRFASHMKTALGEQQIGPASRLYLRDAVWLALETLNKPSLQQACTAAGLIQAPNTWIDYAMIILAGQGAQQARALAHATTMAIPHTPAILQALERLHGAVNPQTGRPSISDSELIKRLNAPMNKMSLLAQTPAINSTHRKLVTWRQIIQQHTTLIINMGGSVQPINDSHESLPDDVKTLIGALLLSGLREETERTCAGWQDDNKHVRIFIDELTEVLGPHSNRTSNTEVLEWLRSKGRAFGVELTTGTQYPEQVDQQTLNLLLGFDTVICFTLRDMQSATTLAQTLSIEPEQILQLAKHNALIKTVSNQAVTLPTMALAIPHFDAGAPA
ncbi:hypothetical protein [Bombiscardovia coagulans]|uniref:Uncharacterized protein n=1 Tax=Bombiscardovia coagulans TaxID=686666 RepID=A0A261ESP1_9BIFI|nr:hypothetical protein [Bombiscardovia coagulans]OZG49855.1 hypothetical protein BOCO_0372 [Bombiscardovia coagulans]